MSLREDPEYNQTMDSIYASFMKRKSLVEGRHDRDVRKPGLILEIARRLDLVPDPSSVIRITGSKGKGTTSRMIAHLLHRLTSRKVGLFVSPEEIDHNDRMRINGVAPTRADFMAAFEKVRPALALAEDSLSGSDYLSPFGIFLLIALQYFKDHGVDVFVLEGGRGAEFDEVGNLFSSIAVVTSILLEHPANLGPTIEDIARNKLFIGTKSKVLVCTAEVAEWAKSLGIGSLTGLSIAEGFGETRNMPFWYGVDRRLAQLAVEEFMRLSISQIALDGQSAAFGRTIVNGRQIFFDACISARSIDRDFIGSLASRGRVVFIASLPDDKDVAGIGEYFTREVQRPYFEIALSGTRGYLHYDKALEQGRVVTELHYEDTVSLRRVVDEIAGSAGADTVYFIGTQTFIRLVKLTFFQSG